MRVLMIGAYPKSPHRIDGGVASALTYLSEALVREPGLELLGVRIVTGSGSAHTAGGFDWPISDLPLGRMSLSTLYLRQKRQFASLVAKFRPDLVHAQGADVAGYVAVDCGVPTVVTIHGLLAECARYQTNPKSRLRATLAAWVTERHTVRRANHVIAISPYVAQYYGSEIRGKVHDIANAVSPSFFQVIRKPERGRLLYAGRIANGKGLLELLQAVARNRAQVTHLVLAGAAQDPDYQVLVATEIDRLELAGKVSLVGLLDEAALLLEFSRAAALVLPSHQETAPMVVQQAMAAGLPVIATRVGGVPHQLDHERTGWLYEPGNADQLAALIETVATDEVVGRRVADAARLIALERFQSSAVARATTAVYHKVLETPIKAVG